MNSNNKHFILTSLSTFNYLTGFIFQLHSLQRWTQDEFKWNNESRFFNNTDMNMYIYLQWAPPEGRCRDKPGRRRETAGRGAGRTRRVGFWGLFVTFWIFYPLTHFPRGYFTNIISLLWVKLFISFLGSRCCQHIHLFFFMLL